MIDLPEGRWFYLSDTAPLSATAPQPFPHWARKRPPPWAFVGWLRRVAVGPDEYPPVPAGRYESRTGYAPGTGRVSGGGCGVVTAGLRA
jgi:hypothetical protein